MKTHRLKKRTTKSNVDITHKFCKGYDESNNDNNAHNCHWNRITGYSAKKRRRGISGLMQVAMIVGIVIIFAGVLFSFASDIFDVQTIADSISLQTVTLQSVNSDTYLSANIKNTGNTDVTGLRVQVLVDTDSTTRGVQPFVADILPSPLRPGMTGSVHEIVIDNSGDSITLATGSEVAIMINATTIDGSYLTEPVTVRVR